MHFSVVRCVIYRTMGASLENMFLLKRRPSELENWTHKSNLCLIRVNGSLRLVPGAAALWRDSDRQVSSLF